MIPITLGLVKDNYIYIYIPQGEDGEYLSEKQRNTIIAIVKMVTLYHLLRSLHKKNYISAYHQCLWS